MGCETCGSERCTQQDGRECLLRAHFRQGLVKRDAKQRLKVLKPAKPTTFQNRLPLERGEHIPHDVIVRGRKRMERVKADLFGSGLLVPCCFCDWEMSYSSATLEHIMPVSKGGQTVSENLTLSCEACNNERGARDFDTYRREMQAKRARR